MSQAVEILGWVLLAIGSVFAVIGGIGLIRLPDFYTRLHAVGITDTFGAGLILSACVLQSGFSFTSIKIITVWAFIYFTGPAATHALGKAAYAHGVKVRGDQEDRRSAISI